VVERVNSGKRFGTDLATFIDVELTGPEKAVLMLLSLDEATAAPIIAELDMDDLRKLREVATVMRAVPASAMDSVYQEFLSHSQEAIAIPKGGVRYLRRVATKALGEAKTQEIFVDGPQSSLDKLGAADDASLAAVLEHEHPQLIAAIVSQLPTNKAVRVLEQLPEEKRPGILERLGKMTEVPAGLLEEIAATLTAELPQAGTEALISVDGVAKSAALVRHMNRETGELLLGSLAEEDSDLATEIRRAMYTFEDLSMLDAKALRSLLESVPSDRLVLSLKTASEKLRAQVFSSMSKRAADRLKEDLEILGGVKLVEVEAAQREIVEQALMLAAEGVISLEEDHGLV
jgi:flagellar motor switch protein FliG